MEDKKEFAEPMDATITFNIPAYKDKDTEEPFERVLVMPTKVAYAIYKREMQKRTKYIMKKKAELEAQKTVKT